MRTKFKAWAEPFIKDHPEIVLQEEESKNLDDFYLEIGSGKGDFILKMSSQNPDKFFVGIEKNVTCAGFMAKKLVDAEIKNAKMVWNDASRFVLNFKDKSVRTIFLNFSDPWPKKKHHKRRLTSDSFLKEYSRILKDDGFIIFKTDNEDLFEFSIETFTNNGFKVISRTDNYLGDDPFDACTEYEAWFNERNIPIHRMVVRK